LEQFGGSVDAPQDDQLEDKPDKPDGQGGADQGCPETRRSRNFGRKRVADIGAQHIKRAVGEVHDARDAKDNGQAGGYEEEGGGAGQPAEELDRDEIHAA
jgi:hypothetical protein